MKKIRVKLYDGATIELMGHSFAIGVHASDPLVITSETNEVLASFTGWNWVAYASVVDRQVGEPEPEPEPKEALPQ